MVEGFEICDKLDSQLLVTIGDFRRPFPAATQEQCRAYEVTLAYVLTSSEAAHLDELKLERNSSASKDKRDSARGPPAAVVQCRLFPA